MKIKGLLDEDIANYKKTAMFIIMPYCTFKCDKENGNQICQNCKLAHESIIDIPTDVLCRRYISNDLSKAVVFGGLEPFDSLQDVYEFVMMLRQQFHCNDDIVIYTGYTQQEIEKGVYYKALIEQPNIIIKFGRFIPNREPHYDEILGKNLASPNQYAVKIS